MSAENLISEANQKAVDKMTSGRPVLVDIKPAIDVASRSMPSLLKYDRARFIANFFFSALLIKVRLLPFC